MMLFKQVAVTLPKGVSSPLSSTEILDKLNELHTNLKNYVEKCLPFIQYGLVAEYEDAILILMKKYLANAPAIKDSDASRDKYYEDREFFKKSIRVGAEVKQLFLKSCRSDLERALEILEMGIPAEKFRESQIEEISGLLPCLKSAFENTALNRLETDKHNLWGRNRSVINQVRPFWNKDLRGVNFAPEKPKISLSKLSTDIVSPAESSEKPSHESEAPEFVTESWRLPSLDDAFKVKNEANPTFSQAIHHLVPKKLIKIMWEKADIDIESDDWTTKPAVALIKALLYIGNESGLLFEDDTSMLRFFLSLPFNLEVGPNTRTDDPGSDGPDFFWGDTMMNPDHQTQHILKFFVLAEYASECSKSLDKDYWEKVGNVLLLLWEGFKHKHEPKRQLTTDRLPLFEYDPEKWTSLEGLGTCTWSRRLPGLDDAVERNVNYIAEAMRTTLCAWTRRNLGLPEKVLAPHPESKSVSGRRINRRSAMVSSNGSSDQGGQPLRTPTLEFFPARQSTELGGQAQEVLPGISLKSYFETDGDDLIGFIQDISECFSEDGLIALHLKRMSSETERLPVETEILLSDSKMSEDDIKKVLADTGVSSLEEGDFILTICEKTTGKKLLAINFIGNKHVADEALARTMTAEVDDDIKDDLVAIVKDNEIDSSDSDSSPESVVVSFFDLLQGLTKLLEDKHKQIEALHQEALDKEKAVGLEWKRRKSEEEAARAVKAQEKAAKLAEVSLREAIPSLPKDVESYIETLKCTLLNFDLEKDLSDWAHVIAWIEVVGGQELLDIFKGPMEVPLESLDKEIDFTERKAVSRVVSQTASSSVQDLSKRYSQRPKQLDTKLPAQLKILVVGAKRKQDLTETEPSEVGGIVSIIEKHPKVWGGVVSALKKQWTEGEVIEDPKISTQTLLI